MAFALSRTLRRRHCFGGGATVNFGWRWRAGPKHFSYKGMQLCMFNTARFSLAMRHQFFPCGDLPFSSSFLETVVQTPESSPRSFWNFILLQGVQFGFLSIHLALQHRRQDSSATTIERYRTIGLRLGILADVDLYVHVKRFCSHFSTANTTKLLVPNCDIDLLFNIT